MGFFVEKPTPFIPEFLNRMMQLEYPKKRIDLFIHNTVSIEILCYVIYWKCLSLILIMILCWHLSWIAQLWGLSFKFIILIITIIISSSCAAVTFCVLCIFFLHYHHCHYHRHHRHQCLCHVFHFMFCVLLLNKYNSVNTVRNISGHVNYTGLHPWNFNVFIFFSRFHIISHKLESGLQTRSRSSSALLLYCNLKIMWLNIKPGIVPCMCHYLFLEK